MIVVLVAAAGASWESGAMAALGAHPGVVVLKRCVDVDDLLAAAGAGQADVAVVALDSPGLDVAVVDHLRRHGVRPVAVVPAAALDAGRVRAARIGVHALVADDEVDRLPAAVTSPDPTPTAVRPPDPAPEVPVPAPGATGRVVAVWGPAGAPGRTTLATAVAGELARRERRTVLVDADPYGGAVAQHLGIMDEVSGLLSAARLTVGGGLADRFASVQRGVDAWLSVVTGLPRADRWTEVRGGTVEHLLEVARGQAHVVVDTGFALEDDASREHAARPGRNQLTLGALEVADDVVVVGSADPVGLSRLARGLVDVRERTGADLHVVVNRMRPSLGWSEREVAGLVAGFARAASVHFLPEDRATVDRALVTGRMLVELGESELGRAVAAVVDALPLEPAAPPVGPAQDANSR